MGIKIEQTYPLCSVKIMYLYENEYPEIGTAKKLSYFERKIESLGIF